MRDRDIKKYLMIFFMTGFTVGIIYINTLGKESVIITEIFNQYWLQQYSSVISEQRQYLMYITRIRMIPLLIIALCGMTRIRKLATMIISLWTGLLAGLLITLAFLQLGVKGLILCILAITPHFLCYGAVLVIILCFMYEYPQSRWNSAKTIFIILMTAMGILTEAYMNPVIMKLYTKTL